jgi:hypothetical protein
MPVYGKRNQYRDVTSITPFNGFNPRDKQPEEWHIKPICKTCKYRRNIDGSAFWKKIKWENTACHYHLDTGTLKETRPTDTHCDYYIQREKKQ